MPVDAALLVAHGTVENLDDLPEFLRRIRRGRPAPEELIAELRDRYEQIGGSPHLAHTRAQAAALEEALGFPVRAAMRLWDPSVEDVLEELAVGGAERVCVLPMAPFSVAVYRDAAFDSRQHLLERAGRAPELVCVPPWGADPQLIAAHVGQILHAVSHAASQAESHDGTAAAADGPIEAVLSAHSLPQRVIDAGDAYCNEFEASADLIAAQLPWPCTTAYQSVGATGGEWVGPDLIAVLRDMAQRGVRRAVVAPIGFLSEHVETLYDLDIEARSITDKLGLSLTRVPALGVNPELIEAAAALIRRCLSAGV